MTAEAGPTIGQYQIIEELGRGGMAVVYKAWQPALERHVALKVLPAYFQHDPDFLARFHREAKAAAKLNHPNIVHIYDTGEANGVHFIAMEYVDGGSLQQRLAGTLLSLDVTQRVLDQVAAGLDHAHARNLIHRDIKPANILFMAGGEAKVADFGIARAADGAQLTRTGIILGTPEYMAPEQAEGQRVDRRVDLYALGVVLYQMLTGSAPFRGTTPHATLHAVIYDPPTPPRQVNPKVSKSVESVLLKALAKQPDDRFQTGREMAGAFRQARAGTTVQVPAAARRETRRGQGSGLPVKALVGAIVGIAVVLAGLMLFLVLPPGGAETADVTKTAPLATDTDSVDRDGTATALAQSQGTQAAIQATETSLASTARVLDSDSATGTAQAVERGRHTATSAAEAQATQTAIAMATDIDSAVRETSDARADQAEFEATQTAQARPTATPPPAPTATPPPSPTKPPTPVPPTATSAPPPPKPQPKGRIAFTSERDGNPEVYVMNTDGSGQSRLTNHPALDGGPAWAPDGKRIAFVSERDGNREIYIMNADGSGQANLTRHPANDASPSWSANGQRIVFETDRDGNREIYVMNADGNGQANLTRHPAKDIQPSWSRAEGRILFNSNRDGDSDIYVMNTDGSGQSRLADAGKGEFTPHFSPDSRRIAFMSNKTGNREIYTMNAGGGGEAQLTNHPGHDYQPCWSPNGKRMAFTSERSGNLEVHVMNADGSGITRLTNHPAQDSDPAWAP